MFAVTGGGEGKVSAASFGGGGGGEAGAVVSIAKVGGGGTAAVEDGGSAIVVALSIGAGRGGELVGTATLGTGAVVRGARAVGTWSCPSETCWTIWAVMVGSRVVVRAKVKMRRGIGLRIADFSLSGKFRLRRV